MDDGDASLHEPDVLHPPAKKPIFSLLMKPICIFSILILVFAISFSLIVTRSPYSLYDAKANAFSSSHLPNFLKFLLTKPVLRRSKIAETTADESLHCVLWMAPFLSGGGYSSEAWSYILALDGYIKKQRSPSFKLRIEQHGDLENIQFWEGLPSEMRNLALELHQTECRMDRTIIICHSEPGAWYPPLFETFPCPPTGYGKSRVVIGRTMFETDRVTLEHTKRCNRMDYVWVPTDFHVNSFKQSGVDPMKVTKIVQPVDSNFFDPIVVEPLDLKLVATQVLGMERSNSRKCFVFLSVFKWEHRKGWDVLLRSYLKEFSGTDDVSLYLLTNPYHSDKDFSNKIIEHVEDSDLVKPLSGWAPVYVIDSHINHVDLPGIYMAADAFVLPSRGEGWGRPIVEAMAMSLPVITTNWSGPTEYLTAENSYPLPVDEMKEVMEGPFKGHLRAEPSVDQLRFLMRRVMNNPSEAKLRGKQARIDMMRRFSPEIVAQVVIEHLQRIVDNLG